LVAMINQNTRQKLKNVFTFTNLLLVAVSAVRSQPQRSESSPQVRNGTYKSSLLGIELIAPVGWYSPTTDELAPAMKAGREDAKIATSGGNVRDEGILNFAVFKKPVGSTENSAFSLATTKQTSELHTAKMIADATREGFSRHPDYRILGGVSTERIADRDFAVLEMGIDSFPKQRVRIYMVREKEFLISFTLSYWDQDDLRVMLNTLHTIKFNRK